MANLNQYSIAIIVNYDFLELFLFLMKNLICCHGRNSKIGFFLWASKISHFPGSFSCIKNFANVTSIAAFSSALHGFLTICFFDRDILGDFVVEFPLILLSAKVELVSCSL